MSSLLTQFDVIVFTSHDDLFLHAISNLEAHGSHRHQRHRTLFDLMFGSFGNKSLAFGVLFSCNL